MRHQEPTGATLFNRMEAIAGNRLGDRQKHGLRLAVQQALKGMVMADSLKPGTWTSARSTETT
jgi:hypothetical protein